MSIDRASGIGLAVFAALVLWQGRRVPMGTLATPGPAYFPFVLALLLLAAGLAIAALGGGTSRASTLVWSEWRHTLAIFAACAFCALALERIGYRLTMFAALAVLVGVVERKRPLTTLVLAAALALGTFLLFDTLLRVPLPRGPRGF